MDDGDRPTPPDDLETDLQAFLTALGDEDVATIRAVEQYVEALASWAEQRTGNGADGPTAAGEDRGGEPPVPSNVPADARVSVTAIGGTEYYYYQWREGDEIRSETVTVPRQS